MLHKSLDALQGMGPVTFAKGIVEETRQEVHFLARAAQPFEKALLRLALDHEVGPGYQQLGGYLNGLGIRHHQVSGFV